MSPALHHYHVFAPARRALTVEVIGQPDEGKHLAAQIDEVAVAMAGEFDALVHHAERQQT